MREKRNVSLKKYAYNGAQHCHFEGENREKNFDVKYKLFENSIKWPKIFPPGQIEWRDNIGRECIANIE